MKALWEERWFSFGSAVGPALSGGSTPLLGDGLLPLSLSALSGNRRETAGGAAAGSGGGTSGTGGGKSPAGAAGTDP